MTDVPANFKPNAFSDDLGTDWIAVNQSGSPVARASDEASVRAAAPECVYLTGSDFDASAPADPAPVAEEPAPEAVADPAPADPAPADPAA